jgi:hypothetical protein
MLDTARVEELATLGQDAPVFLCGSVENEKDVWALFDRVICLAIDDETLRRRLAARVTNDFGKSAEELAMVLGWNATTEATYRELGATIIDATVPLDQVVDAVLASFEDERWDHGEADLDASRPPETAMDGESSYGAG